MICISHLIYFVKVGGCLLSL